MKHRPGYALWLTFLFIILCLGIWLAAAACLGLTPEPPGLISPWLSGGVTGIS